LVEVSITKVPDSLGIAAAILAFLWQLPLGIADEQVLARLPETAPASKENPITPERAELGRRLFFDVRLSGNNQMSCATCHVPEKGFADGLPRGKGHEGRRLPRNTPTVLNVGLQSRFFWDGRAETLEEQALGPVQSPEEMHQDVDELVRELIADPNYPELFQRAFGGTVQRESIAQALAAYQRTLITRHSPFDRYLSGEKLAISDEAKRGLSLFTGAAGCVRCHNGPTLGDGKFYRIGASFKDKGREAVTGRADDRYKFRTPPLREVARTGPYMHDGSRKTLSDVVEFTVGCRCRPPTDRSSMFKPCRDRVFLRSATLWLSLKLFQVNSPMELPQRFGNEISKDL